MSDAMFLMGFLCGFLAAFALIAMTGVYCLAALTSLPPGQIIRQLFDREWRP